MWKNWQMQTKKKLDAQAIKGLLTECIYLENTGTIVHGLHIYGTPHTLECGNWAFPLPNSKEARENWELIPEDTDILMTHQPPAGLGDKTRMGSRIGCSDLLNRVRSINLLVHVFGHVHNSYGYYQDDTSTWFVNASSCNSFRKANNRPIVFDIKLDD
eukprot:TRINITY_DN12403_c0_g1_i1.p1 TRINITY_DN12403_c0_g1~~TRINITY_DN12403_c0_g1_i1.p1  ORF type:complete len:158 (-),score=29.86 TRINITY_DN12403_c0_g1_i1:72-545(-)